MNVLPVKYSEFLRRVRLFGVPVQRHDGFSAVETRCPVGQVAQLKFLHHVDGRRNAVCAPLVRHVQHLMLLRPPGENVRTVGQ